METPTESVSTANTEQSEEPEQPESEKEVKSEKSQSRSRSRSPLRREEEPKELEEDNFSDSEEVLNNDDTALLNSDDTALLNSAPFDTRPHINKGNRMLKPKLLLNNIPTAWTYDDVKKFVKSTVNSKQVADNVGYVCLKKQGLAKGDVASSLVFFGTEAAANEACNRLNGLMVHGRQLTASVVHCTGKTPQQAFDMKQKAATGSTNRDCKLVMVVKHPNFSNETYGLDQLYLKSLGLSPPLQSRVIVYNLDPAVDVAKIREVFSLAGQIVDIYMRRKKRDETFTGFVRIEYDHPVEAVQAISMFRNQKLYNKPINIKMESSIFPYKRPIPMGLTNIGPGLGNNGEPLQYVRAHVEIQSIKELVKTLSTFQAQAIKQEQNAPTPTMTPAVANTNAPAVSLLNDLLKMCQWNTNTVTAGTTPNADPMGNVPLQNTQSVEQNMSYFNNQFPNTTMPPPNFGKDNWQLQGNAGNNQTTTPAQTYPAPSQYSSNFLENIAHSNFGQNTANYNLGQNTTTPNNESHKRNRDSRGFRGTAMETEEYFRNKCGDIIVFKNLPASVSVEALKSKMSEVGELKGVEMTGPGKALVRFVRERDAEKCLKLFDRSKVDGHIITARYF
ncbi:uncharacterized protein [Epargyreus clarus]|uniref:uncharacterized protein isoform X2 n=1 Tax=Epargyreus clarus TaxID=520877 RepID=UPI003C2E4CB6